MSVYVSQHQPQVSRRSALDNAHFSRLRTRIQTRSLTGLACSLHFVLYVHTVLRTSGNIVTLRLMVHGSPSGPRSLASMPVHHLSSRLGCPGTPQKLPGFHVIYSVQTLTRYRPQSPDATSPGTALRNMLYWCIGGNLSFYQCMTAGCACNGYWHQTVGCTSPPTTRDQHPPSPLTRRWGETGRWGDGLMDPWRTASASKQHTLLRQATDGLHVQSVLYVLPT